MKIAYAGTPHFGALVLGSLLRSRHRVEIVFTQPDRPAGRGRRQMEPPVKLMAEAEGLRVEQPDSISSQDTVDMLAAAGVEILTIAAYGQILKGPLLGSLPIINVHASLLPKYRGASPIERAIMAGERVTGVSIMDVIAELDSGDVYIQRPVQIEDEDDAGSLYEKLGAAGGEALVEVLDALEENGFIPQPQSHIDLCYAEKISRDDLKIDWARPAWEIANQVRALSPHIGAYTEASGHRLKIWRAKAGEGGDDPGSIVIDGERLLVSCGSGTLELLEVQPEGKRRMGAAEYLRGRRGLSLL